MASDDGWSGLRVISETIARVFKGKDGTFVDALFEIAKSISYVGRVFDVEFQNRWHEKSEKEEHIKQLFYADSLSG